MQLVAAKARFIGLDQAHLPHCGCGLQFMDGAGALLPAQPLHAFSHRTAGHQHDFLAHTDQLRDLRRPVGQRGMIEAAAIVGDQRAAHFDDQAAGIFQYRIHRVGSYSCGAASAAGVASGLAGSASRTAVTCAMMA